MPYKDPAVRRAKHAEHMRHRYHNDAEYRKNQLQAVRHNNTRYRQLVQERILQVKSGGCLLCGESEPCCLGFHHRDPAIKEFDIGNAYSRCTSLARLNRELAKCVCVCHNCHAKLHAGVAHLP